MRILLLTLMGMASIYSYGQSDEELILRQAKAFSTYLVAGERAKVVAMYTDDAKIFPSDLEILSEEALSEYWNPSTPSSWSTTYHKITPVEVKVWGDEAYDYGYYEGMSSNGTTNASWKGKYVIVWRKVAGEWKIYLDIWNAIK